jgi:hypothetical protein
MPIPTYVAHEGDHRGLARALGRYAAFYRVSFEWLANGREPMKPGQKDPISELLDHLDPQLHEQAIDYIRFLISKQPK